MPKEKLKPCNLTEKEWDLLLDVFDSYEEYSAELREIYLKIFFMDALIKDQEEEDA